jgi:hypothetical protein
MAGLRVMEERSEVWCEIPKEGGHYDDLVLHGRIIFKWILKKWDENMWTGFMSFGTGTTVRLL